MIREYVLRFDNEIVRYAVSTMFVFEANFSFCVNIFHFRSKNKRCENISMLNNRKFDNSDMNTYYVIISEISIVIELLIWKPINV